VKSYRKERAIGRLARLAARLGDCVRVYQVIGRPASPVISSSRSLSMITLEPYIISELLKYLPTLDRSRPLLILPHLLSKEYR
jgi:hypothetical protein